MKLLLKKYFYWCGLIAHILGFCVLTLIVINLYQDHWRVQQIKRAFSGAIDDLPVTHIDINKQGSADYQNFPFGKWIKIYQQSSEDSVYFSRQRHSGSAYDTKRNKLILFGSDTHGNNWDNSIYTFDLVKTTWKKESPSFGPETYSVDDSGNAIAGSRNKPFPWAMHTFDAINYLPKTDELVISSSPRHLAPGRFGNWVNDVWSKVKKHPTWMYSFSSRDWYPAKGSAVSFFPYATAYDSSRGVIVGFRPDGVFEFDRDTENWTKTIKPGVPGYHTQAIYDKKNNAFLSFGNHKLSNDIYVYRTDTDAIVVMPTRGKRPPVTQHTPFAYHSKLGESVALIDNPTAQKPGATTWKYSLNLDRWEKIASADFPYRLGMNYHLQYSNEFNLLVLVASAPNEPPSVWILKI